ncbi:MAG TPA: hypothetical protein VEJ18_17820, partial [Planctomycetota bacterium]|nr:hypothetical protein [Planctomycetota bacterium]
MGREIVYCWKCAKRLGGADFQTRKAFRYGDKVSCHECVYDLVGELSTEEQEAILQGTPPPSESRPSSSSSNRPAASTTSRVRKTGPIPTTKTTQRVTAVRKTTTQKINAGEMREATGQRRAVTRSIPKGPPPEEVEGDEAAGEEADPAVAKKKKLILIGAGGGGLLLVVVVLLIVLLGGKKKPPPPVEAPVAATTVPKKDPRKEKEEAARKAYQDAVLLINDKPDDLAAQLAALQAVEKVAADFPDLREQVATQLEILTATRIPTEIKKIEEEAWGFLKPREFQPKKAFEYMETALLRHDIPEWKSAVELSREKVKARVEEFFSNQKRQALENKEAGIAAKVKEVEDLVAGWDLPEYKERLQKELATAAAPATVNPADPAVAANPDASKPKPAARRELKPLPDAIKGYLPTLRRAMGHVAIRDFDSGSAEIRKLLRDLEGDAKAAANEDVETIEKLKAWMEEAGKVLAKIRFNEKVTLEFQDRPGEFKTVQGTARFVNDQRTELYVVEEKDGKKIAKKVYVEWLAL